MAARKPLVMNAGRLQHLQAGDSVEGDGSSLTGLTKSQVGLGNCDNTADTAKPVSTAQQTALNLKANLASPTFTGTVNSATLKSSGDIHTTGGAVGCAAGNGGTVTQATSRTTGVTLNKMCGEITTNSASLAALASATFTVTNSQATATTIAVLCKKSGAVNDKTDVRVASMAVGSFQITVHNLDPVTAETGAIVIKFMLFRIATT